MITKVIDPPAYVKHLTFACYMLEYKCDYTTVYQVKFSHNRIIYNINMFDRMYEHGMFSIWLDHAFKRLE